MSNNYFDYYNNFYSELSKFDELGNDFGKISNILPKLKTGIRILDIGSGYGGVSWELIKMGFDVTAVEISEKALVVLKERGFTVINKDITNPLNLSESYNIVLILDVLEHLFDPIGLLKEAKKVLKDDGCIIISVPLYFDIIDRFKIFFTGSVISVDNLCYGEKNYLNFRSYNYDHIRFFRPYELIEIGKLLDLDIEEIIYVPTSYPGKSKFLKFIFRIISNKFTVKCFPNLVAHNMKIRWGLKK